MGHDLHRPECVVALQDGSWIVSDHSAVVTCIRPDGTQHRYGRASGLPNGFAIDDRGELMVADLANGAVLGLSAAGEVRTLYDRCEGQPLGAANFVLADDEAAVRWITASTRRSPFQSAISHPLPDGRIYRADGPHLTLVADGLYFPNEMRVDRQRGAVYVVETTAGRISRAPLLAGDEVGEFSPFGPAPLYPGAYPDGLTLDEEGNLWITELSRNAILMLDMAGRLHAIFEDPTGKTLNKPTSLAFGGADLRTVAVGTLKMDVLPLFRSPVPGRPARHWRMNTRFGAWKSVKTPSVSRVGNS
ncbi:SMP-30/gluconolactonase/LRE family protein [Paraburkholderia sp. GAS348]|uniref:SMP-30/gluconolactonase/LRE family protein n=1 Tax=Paraburkholderia sp. GAS348 TaxID=3035132 RepID=UPI003D239C7C